MRNRSLGGGPHGIATLRAGVLSESRPARGLAGGNVPSAVAFDGTETRYRFELAS